MQNFLKTTVVLLFICIFTQPGYAELNEGALIAAPADRPPAVLYLMKLKKLAADSPELLAEEVIFPFSLYERGRIKKTYADVKAFRKDRKKIFNKKVLNAIMLQKEADLFRDDQGMMIGNGELWCRTADEEAYKIYAINPSPGY